MGIKIALAGNPNSGKTTLFNLLTGSTQYVGNWPGVTVEKKEGKIKNYKDVTLIDLPGIYSLSPYTLEEVVTRDFLLNERPDVIINIVDASNIERNLYLTTQLIETGIPIVVALNMFDAVRKNGDIVKTSEIAEALKSSVFEISALKNEGIKELTDMAIETAKAKKNSSQINIFSSETSKALDEIKKNLPQDISVAQVPFVAVKVFERDEKMVTKLVYAPGVIQKIEEIITQLEKTLDDDSESIITNERYEYISKLVQKCVKKKNIGLSTSDKIDQIVTSKIYGLPIFVAVMFFVYYVSVTSVGTILTDFTNDTVVGVLFQTPVAAWLESVGTAPWLTGLVVDGIIGGVGAVLGFLPQMLILFFFLAILEDCGYLARVAFLMDRIFKRFGMSGKAFIGLLISTGCGVPGIMASRTIEAQLDRRMAIITTTFMPCGAKLPIIALISGAMFGGAWWVAPSAYFLGIASVVISGIILKKTKPFMGDPAPFVIELPTYHTPSAGNVFRSVWNRGYSFAKRAVTFITITSIFIWFAASFGFVDGAFGLVENMEQSVLRNIGSSFAWIFAPIGFGTWEPAVATIMGLAAKEEVVSVFGVLTSIGGADAAFELVESSNSLGLAPIAALFTSGLAAYSYLIFNLLCAPCFAAMSAIKSEMNSVGWTSFAIGYQCVFAYIVALIIYQFGLVFIGGQITIWTIIAAGISVYVAYLLFRPLPKDEKVKNAAVAA